MVRAVTEEEYSKGPEEGVVHSVGPAPERLLPLQIVEVRSEDNFLRAYSHSLFALSKCCFCVIWSSEF